MPNALAIEPVPLVTGPGGVIHVEGTRIPLETVVQAFRRGATAEEIAQQFPAIPLGVAFQVVGYYLRHRAEVESYLTERETLHAEVRAANESRWPADGVREHLLARRK